MQMTIMNTSVYSSIIGIFYNSTLRVSIWFYVSKAERNFADLYPLSGMKRNGRSFSSGSMDKGRQNFSQA